jgi:hypothetical protein
LESLKVKVRSEEKRLGVSFREIRSSRARTDTPRRALSLTSTGYSEALAELHPDTQGMVELYRELTPETLEKLHSDNEGQQQFTLEMSRRVAQIRTPGSLVLSTLAFRDKGYCPKGRMVDYLADLSAAPFVDAVAVPAVLPKSRTDYFQYAQSFVAAFERIDHIPLLGYVPNFAYRDVLKTIAMYHKLGIKDFVIEFNGHHAGVLYPNIQGITRTLRKEVGDDFFLHGLNVGPGAFRRNLAATPSRDFLALLAGVDSMGSKHVRKKMPLKVWKKLAAKPDRGRRLFARSDYGYYDPSAYRRKFGNKKEVGVIGAGPVCRNPEPVAVQMFNAERQGLEAKELRRRLDGGTLLNYAQSKSLLRGEIAKVASGSGQVTLSV